MIETVWPYLAIMLLIAGAVSRRSSERYRWRVFSVLPPIVLTYLFVTALAVGGLWSPTGESRRASALIAQLLPALLFLLMVTATCARSSSSARACWRCSRARWCSLRGDHRRVRAVPPRGLPQDGWKPLAALSGSWVGGSANLVAVKEAIGLSDNLLALALLTDALCYSLWVRCCSRVARSHRRSTAGRGALAGRIRVVADDAADAAGIRRRRAAVAGPGVARWRRLARSLARCRPR